MTDPASRNRSDFSATRRRFLGTSLAAAGAFTGGSLLTFLPAGAQDLYTCRMQLGWLASNGILGEIAADEKGFYAEEGLSLRSFRAARTSTGSPQLPPGQPIWDLTRPRLR